MRRITFMLMSTLAGVILLFSYRTSTQGASPSGTAAGGSGTTNATTSTSGTTTTAKGSTVQTRWGPVQVQVTISGGKITDVVALQQPDGNQRDQEINAAALPQLHDEVIAAQSAKVDGISGATVTSDGYISSLQAALDAAHFG